MTAAPFAGANSGACGDPATSMPADALPVRSCVRIRYRYAVPFFSLRSVKAVSLPEHGDRADRRAGPDSRDGDVIEVGVGRESPGEREGAVAGDHARARDLARRSGVGRRRGGGGGAGGGGGGGGAASSFLIVPTPCVSGSAAPMGFARLTAKVSSASTTVSPRAWTEKVRDVWPAVRVSVVCETAV